MGKRLSYIAQTEHEAWIAMLFSCAMSDGDILSQREVNRITQLRFRSAMLPEPNNQRIFASVYLIAKECGPIALVDGALNRIHHDDKKTLFTYCCEVIYAEGELTEQKKQILFYIGRALAISPDFFKVCTTYQRAHSAKDDPYLGDRLTLLR
jgi:hypothetical protein